MVFWNLDHVSSLTCPSDTTERNSRIQQAQLPDFFLQSDKYASSCFNLTLLCHGSHLKTSGWLEQPPCDLPQLLFIDNFLSSSIRILQNSISSSAYHQKRISIDFSKEQLCKLQCPSSQPTNTRIKFSNKKNVTLFPQNPCEKFPKPTSNFRAANIPRDPKIPGDGRIRTRVVASSFDGAHFPFFNGFGRSSRGPGKNGLQLTGAVGSRFGNY